MNTDPNKRRQKKRNSPRFSSPIPSAGYSQFRRESGYRQSDRGRSTADHVCFNHAKIFLRQDCTSCRRAGLKHAMRKGVLPQSDPQGRKEMDRGASGQICTAASPAARYSARPGECICRPETIHLPSRLYGGLSATFYIPEGVPKPTGDYGHSRIYDFQFHLVGVPEQVAHVAQRSRAAEWAQDRNQQMIIIESRQSLAPTRTRSMICSRNDADTAPYILEIIIDLLNLGLKNV